MGNLITRRDFCEKIYQAIFKLYLKNYNRKVDFIIILVERLTLKDEKQYIINEIENMIIKLNKINKDDIIKILDSIKDNNNNLIKNYDKKLMDIDAYYDIQNSQIASIKCNGNYYFFQNEYW